MSNKKYDDVDDLIFSGGGAPSISWKGAKVGTTFEYVILGKERSDVKDDDGDPVVFKDGNVQQQLILTVQTNLRNNELMSELKQEQLDPADDDGVRRLFLKQNRNQLTPFKEAVKESGATSIKIGASGTVTLKERNRIPGAPPTNSPANVFAFTYVEPKDELPLADLDGKSEKAAKSEAGETDKAAIVAAMQAAGMSAEAIAAALK